MVGHGSVWLGWIVVGAVGVSGCLAAPLEGTEEGTEESGGSGESGGDAATSDPISAASTNATATATADGAGDDGGGTAVPGVQHPECGEPVPDPPPPSATGNLSPDGTPAFAAWQLVSCDDPAVLAWPPCMQDSDCAEGICTMLGGSAGVCTDFDIDIWCDGEGEVTGTSDGGCWVCMAPEQHASACCGDPDGHIDCRTWPFVDDPSVRGQPCAQHEDCEAGLLCSGTAGSGYGICACPGTVASSIIPAQSCF